MGTMTLAAVTPYLAAANKAKGSSLYTLLILVVLVGLFYMLIMRPQRNRQRKIMHTQSQVMPGQRIRTTAGMYGTVVSGDDRDIVIEIAPGVHVTMLRRAVMDVVSDEDTAAPQPMTDSAQEEEQSHEDAVSSDDREVKNPNI